MGNNRYVEEYLEYFDWNLEMKSPSVTGGLSEKEENENTDKN